MCILLYVSHTSMKLILRRGKAFSQLTLMFLFFSNQYYHQSIHRNTGGLTEKFQIRKFYFLRSQSLASLLSARKTNGGFLLSYSVKVHLDFRYFPINHVYTLHSFRGIMTKEMLPFTWKARIHLFIEHFLPGQWK